MFHLMQRLGIAALFIGLSSCAVVNVSSSGSTPLARDARWVLLPVMNHTETPQAGLRAETILLPLLHQQGLKSIGSYPANLNQDSLLGGTEQATMQQAKKWAQEQGYRYAISGGVDEWRYKVGVDGEPAVGLNLLVWDLSKDQIVWSAVGGKSGYSREALSAVAQKLMTSLLKPLPLVDNGIDSTK